MNANTDTERHVRPTEAAQQATKRVLRALEENTRLARRQMLAIDQYVDTMARYLAVRPGVVPAARRHATSAGLLRLKEYLARKMSEAEQQTATGSSERHPLLEREQS
jgi:hypothetical protein